MADIAILVAEEHERMIKNSKKRSGAEGEEIDLVPCVSVMAKRLDGSSWLKKKIGDENMVLVKWVLEPKSQIGLAAFNGLFSA